MPVLDIKNCERKDVPIYYRRVYTGIAVFESLSKTMDINIDWTIETSPFGTTEITVNVLDKVEYPLIPLVKELREKIDSLDAAGKLPL